MSEESPKRALVLSGGGARGAYEAGVVRYILEVLPDYLGKRPQFDIICGTSVGAINAAWIAATVDQPARCIRRMEVLWQGLEFSEAVKFSYLEVLRLMRRLFMGQTLSLPRPNEQRHGGFLKTGFFDRIIGDEIPFGQIEANLKAGLLDAVSVSATNIITGQTTVFAQSAKELPPWTRDVRRVAQRGPLNPKKVLASAAIPLLFPAVRIGQYWYCDGGVRQNTPISPALRLGADRVLVVALRQRTMRERVTPRPDLVRRHRDHPSQAFIIGKLLDALLLDPLEYDLDVLERVNAILEYGEEAFGEEVFVDRLNEVIRAHRGQGYRVVHPLLLRPSEDIGALAARFARQQPRQFWGSLPLRTVAQRALEAEGAQESDFLSYLLFDGGFTGQLLSMGYEDAAQKRDALVEFFSD